MIEPGLFVGTVRHRRFTPASHEFTYDVCMAFVDVDRIPELMRASPFTSYNRWNWASFDERDHFGDPSIALRDRLGADAARRGLVLPDGPIFLLTNLRYLGYCFNPISVFYAFDRGGRLEAVMAEVHNTFGGAHNYWLEPAGSSGVFRSRAAKALYVSPFLPPDLRYGFALTRPEDRVTVHIEASRGEEATFDATLSLARRPWSGREILTALVRQPAMTAKVTAAIHWEAVRLWWKGVPVVPRPTPNGEWSEQP